jgi:radical SAM superfamily enzyme YgiQ (UPF0313 family)
VGSLWYREGNKVIQTAPAPVDPNFPQADFVPAWKLLCQAPYQPNLRNYRPHKWHVGWRESERRNGYASILTTVGCPFSCEFCCIQAPLRDGARAAERSANIYLRRDPELVGREVAFLTNELGVRYIKVHDEMFVLHRGHVRKVCESIIQQAGEGAVNAWAYSRVDTTHPELLEILRRAGILWLGIGIEAANSQVRDGQDKGFSDESILEVVDRVHDAGLSVGANYIFGLPGETMANLQETLDLATTLRTWNANFYCAAAWPGSPLYTNAVATGVRVPGAEGGEGWVEASQHAWAFQPMPTDALAPAEILRFRDQAWLEYFSNSRWKRMIREQYGEEGLRGMAARVSTPPLARQILGDPRPEIMSSY